MGTRAARAHERDGLRLGLNGRNRHCYLADGAVVSHRVAISAVARCGRWFLEPGRTAGRRRNYPRRQHGLSMARISTLRGDHSFRRLHARCLVGSADVSLSTRRTNLHYAMVFAWRVSLVSMAVRPRAIDALCRAGAGSFAIGCRLVVRE